jgi:hypothetical protein
MLQFESYAAPAYDATVALIKGYKDAIGAKTPADVGMALRDEVFEGLWWNLLKQACRTNRWEMPSLINCAKSSPVGMPQPQHETM